MADHTSTVASLIQAAEAAAADRTDPLAVLTLLLKMLIRSDADPYLLAGVLAEGLASTIAQRIPADIQVDVSREIVLVLRDRLKAHGVASPDL